MDKQMFFLSGLPRSGSTLLASLLNQNPQVHVSPTSVLVGLLKYTNDVWQQADHTNSYQVPGQWENVMSGITWGLYKHVDKPVIIDKNRAWPNPLNIEKLEKLLGYKPKIICTVRDIPGILASFIRLAEKNPIKNFMDHTILKEGGSISTKSRCRALMYTEGHVYQSWWVLKEGFQKCRECLHIVEFEDLINNPQGTIDGIYDFLGLVRFQHNLTNIVNPVQEDDKVYGLPGMHTVKKQIEKNTTDPLKILGEELMKTYSDGEFWRV